MIGRILARLVPLLYTVITPALRDMLAEFVDEFEKRAKQTANPWDDLVADILRAVLCSPRQNGGDRQT
jgi:hypothetical protein